MFNVCNHHMKSILFVILALSACVCFGEVNGSLESVTFKVGDQWLTAAELDARGAGVISADDKEFQRQILHFKLFVFPDSETNRYMLIYHQGLGKTMWTIYASKAAIFSRPIKGMGREGHDRPNIQPLQKAFEDALRETKSTNK